MIVYNVTIKIDTEAHDSWVEWMTYTHIPDVLNTGLFTGHKMLRLLEQDDTEGFTYVIQYFCKDLSTFKLYEEKYSPLLRRQHTERYKNKFVAFRTLMEAVNS